MNLLGKVVVHACLASAVNLRKLIGSFLGIEVSLSSVV
jgi:hypothetical protein